MSNKINVILVDDHEIVRLGLKSFLNLQGDVEVVGEASNGREGVDLALELRPDVVVLVFVMPELLTCNPDHQGWSILHTSFLRLPVSDYMHCCLNQISVHSLYLAGAGLR